MLRIGLGSSRSAVLFLPRMHRGWNMATIHWKNGISGTFDTAFDWSGDVVPGLADDVVLDATGFYTVTTSLNETANSLATVSSGASDLDGIPDGKVLLTSSQVHQDALNQAFQLTVTETNLDGGQGQTATFSFNDAASEQPHTSAHTHILNTSSASAAQVPAPALTVSTDKPDYSPGQTATFTAANVPVGDAVKFSVAHVTAGNDGIIGTADDVYLHDISGTTQSWTVVDGGIGDLDGVANGKIVTSWQVHQDALNQAFQLTATDVSLDGSHGQTATTNFTDTGPVIVINSVADLETGHYVLGANIDASGFNFVPIGYSSSSTTNSTIPGGYGPLVGVNATPAQFIGTFDGNGYTISNLTINNTGAFNLGLFSWIGAAGTVNNVELLNGSLTAGSGYQNLGLLAGWNFGTISNAYATGAVSTGSSFHIGGWLAGTGAARSPPAMPRSTSLAVMDRAPPADWLVRKVMMSAAAQLPIAMPRET
jgi:hypothetical protein